MQDRNLSPTTVFVTHFLRSSHVAGALHSRYVYDFFGISPSASFSIIRIHEVLSSSKKLASRICPALQVHTGCPALFLVTRKSVRNTLASVYTFRSALMTQEGRYEPSQNCDALCAPNDLNSEECSMGFKMGHKQTVHVET